MAFSLNQSLSHISIDEPNLVDLYRSTNRAIPPDKLCEGHACEAYVCASRENDLFQVFVAFFDTTTRRPIIFSSSCDLRKKTDHKHLVNEALKLAASMGFNMEPVNLDYSTAMRQVIMRGIRVMRPPAPPRPAKRHTIKDAAPLEETLPAVPQPGNHCEQTQAAADDRFQSSDLSNTTSASDRQSAEMASLVAETAGLRNALACHAQEKAAAEKTAGELGHELTAAKQRISSLQHELADLRQDTATSLQCGEQRFSEEIARRTEELRVASARERQLDDELATLRTEVGAVQSTLKNILKEREVLIHERDALRTELSVVKESAGITLQREHRALEQELGEVKQNLHEREIELQETRQKHDAMSAEKNLGQKASHAELHSLTSRLEQLLSEKEQWDSATESFKKKARKAVERLKREKQALEEKVARLEGKTAGTQAVPIPAGTDVKNGTGSYDADSPFAALGLSASNAGFGGFGVSAASGNNSVFHEAPDVKVVSYRSTDEIIDLYGSCNVAQAKLQGRKPQNCSAYICVVKQEGKPAIHLAWHLIETGEVVICLPEQQPEDTASYARTLQDALNYFEIAGFMMDRFELSPGSQRQLQALEKIGICTF